MSIAFLGVNVAPEPKQGETPEFGWVLTGTADSRILMTFGFCHVAINMIVDCPQDAAHLMAKLAEATDLSRDALLKYERERKAARNG